VFLGGVKKEMLTAQDSAPVGECVCVKETFRAGSCALNFDMQHH
jgi:hypothetical protein